MELFQIRPFEYLKPRSVHDALSSLEKMGEEAKVIAGGTEVVIYLKSRQISPKYLVDIGDLKELEFIKEDGEFLRVGPLTTHHALEKSPLVKKRACILGEAASQIGTVQVRNMGTIGGNLVNASPAADTATPLLALGASLRLMSISGERVVPIEVFFVDVKKTILQGNELLTEIQVPDQPPKTGAAFMKVGRRAAHDLSVVNVATAITVDEGACKDVRIALGSVAPTPIRAKKAEGFLKEKTLEKATIKKASEIASEEIRPISDVRASTYYRKEISKVLVRLTIQKAIERIGE